MWGGFGVVGFSILFKALGFSTEFMVIRFKAYYGYGMSGGDFGLQ